MPLAACSNSSFGDQIERSFAPDPRLVETGATPGSATLPADFPDAVPQYPQAELVAVNAPDPTLESSGDRTVQTTWQTADSAEQVLAFYRSRLSDDNWQVVEPPGTNLSPETTEIQARRGDLVLTVAIPAASAADTPADPAEAGEATAATEFTLTYAQSGETLTEIDSADPSAQAGRGASRATDTLGRSPTPDASPSPAAPRDTLAAQSFADLEEAPDALQPYLTDLAQLGVLSVAEGSDGAGNLQPNEPITRRQFARWLLTTNNLFFSDRPANTIRLSNASNQPVFQDVPQSDPDFEVIQGLAEAGLVPSPLSGEATTVTFRPDAPLTREDLLTWKVPLDVRRNLPTATVDAIQQTWGFQDTARIAPVALKAVLADFQNGDLANIRRAFGFTTLLQPKKSVTRAEAAATLWYFGYQGEGVSAEDVLQR
mgnify:CR=1 FL=1